MQLPCRLVHYFVGFETSSTEVGFEADRKQENDYSHFREQMQDLTFWIDHAGHRCSQQHSSDQLTEDGWLADPFGEHSAKLCPASIAARSPRNWGALR